MELIRTGSPFTKGVDFLEKSGAARAMKTTLTYENQDSPPDYRARPRHSERPTKDQIPPPVRIFMAVAAKCA